MKKVLRNNSLSLVFFLLFLVSIVGQTITGLKQYNENMQEKGGQQVGLRQYLSSGHFLESTFENWESEFLQMGLFVVMTIFLYQKGSSESKDPDDPKGLGWSCDGTKKDCTQFANQPPAQTGELECRELAKEAGLKAGADCAAQVSREIAGETSDTVGAKAGGKVTVPGAELGGEVSGEHGEKSSKKVTITQDQANYCHFKALKVEKAALDKCMGPPNP